MGRRLWGVQLCPRGCFPLAPCGVGWRYMTVSPPWHHRGGVLAAAWLNPLRQALTGAGGGLRAQCECDGTEGEGDATLLAGSWGPAAPLGTPFLGGGVVPVVPGLAPALLPMARSSPRPMGQGWGGAVPSTGAGGGGGLREEEGFVVYFFFKSSL